MLAYQMMFSAEVEVTRQIQTDRGAKWLQLGGGEKGEADNSVFSNVCCALGTVLDKKVAQQ